MGRAVLLAVVAVVAAVAEVVVDSHRVAEEGDIHLRPCSAAAGEAAESVAAAAASSAGEEVPLGRCWASVEAGTAAVADDTAADAAVPVMEEAVAAAVVKAAATAEGPWVTAPAVDDSLVMVAAVEEP